MGTLTLQIDPEVQDMVSQWEDGGKYYVTLEITQTSNDGKTFTATVDEVTDYGDSQAETETETPPAPAMPAKKMPAKVPVNAKATTTTY